MIRTRLWAPFVALVLSCHAPRGAQFRAVGDPAASAKDPAQSVISEETLASGDSAAYERDSPRTRRKTIAENPEPERVTLCCDLPSGLCYPDDGALCLTETSRMVECPVVAVREITDGFVVCAD